jgi:multiple sugar transport system permease protein
MSAPEVQLRRRPGEEPAIEPRPHRSRSQRAATRRSRMLVMLSLGVITAVLAFPAYWVVATAFKSPEQLNSAVVVFWPVPAHVENFVEAVTKIPFAAYTVNSLFLSTVSGVLTTFSSALVGYGFPRLHGPGKNILFGVLIAMMMMPGIVTLIPTYLLFSRVGLVGNYWPWVIWGLAGSPYLIFLYRQFFAGLPKELEEAAILDGCSQLGIFVRIFLPISKPIVLTAFVMSFLVVWGDFIAPNLLLNQSNTTLAVALTSGYVNERGFPLNNLIAAGSILYVIPVVLVFFFVQRRYTENFSAAGIK